MLRDLDLNRQNCNFPQDDQSLNQIPLTNEHGDLFRHNEYDDCGPLSGEDGYGNYPHNQLYYNNQRPSPVESDYFYDQYVDYPINETMKNTLNNTLTRLNQTLQSPYVDFNQNKFNQNLLPPSHPPPSRFTFFGHSLPSLSLGNVWGTGRAASNRATSAETGSRGKGRVQIFRPGDPGLEVIVNRQNNDVDQFEPKNREPAASDKKPVVDDQLLKIDEKFYRPYPHFQTTFSEPKPEKGFSPLIPGVQVGGFVPMEVLSNPQKNKSKEEKTNNDWPNHEDMKEVSLLTKPELQARSPLIEKVDKFGLSTSVSHHLTTSISPILSTLGPKVEFVTEVGNEEDVLSEEDIKDIDESSLENKSRDNKLEKPIIEEKVHQKNRETTQRDSTSMFSSTNSETITTENVATLTENFTSVLPSTTTESEQPVSQSNKESTESSEQAFDIFNTSSSLSADHLIAPGGLITHDLLYKSPIFPPKKVGKITKVISPVPASNSDEISKTLVTSQPQQQSSEPPSSFDNEYQPNQIFSQTFNDNERISETPQYEREDMEWYFNNYNKSQSGPILNYNRNLQAFGNSEQNTASRLNLNYITLATLLTVLRASMLL